VAKFRERECRFFDHTGGFWHFISLDGMNSDFFVW